jgi:hypothetical protein
MKDGTEKNPLAAGEPLQTQAELLAGETISLEEFRQRLLAVQSGNLADAMVIYNLPRITLDMLDMWEKLAGETVLREAVVTLHPPLAGPAGVTVLGPDGQPVRH